MPEPRPEHSLVPRPRKVASRPGRFTLAPDTGIRAYPGAEGAADLLRTLIGPTTGLRLAPSATGRVVLALEPQLSGLGEEGYGLTIGPDTVLLRAARPAGLLCGVQTLRQLLPAEALSAGARRGVPGRCPAWRSAMCRRTRGAARCSTSPGTSSRCPTCGVTWTSWPCTS